MDSAAAGPSPPHVRPLLLAAPEAHRSLPRRRAARQAVHGDDQAVAERAAQLGGCGLGGSKVRLTGCSLPAVLTTAVEEDKILPRNPCRVRGAGDEQTAERPVRTANSPAASAQTFLWPRPSCVERVRRIELPLSAWESEPSGLLWHLTCEMSCPSAAVRDPDLRKFRDEQGHYLRKRDRGRCGSLLKLRTIYQ